MTSDDAASPATEPVVPSETPRPMPAAAGLGAKLRVGILVLGLAILAGVGAWFSGEKTFGYFQPSLEASSQSYDFRALNREMAQAGAGNGALAFGALGGLLGLGLGVAGGLVRRSVGGALLGGVVGLVLGAAAGALPSLVVMPWQWRHRNDDPASLDLFVPMLVHLALWSAIGLAAGLAFGVGNSGTQPSRIGKAALAGLVGAILGTVVFEVVGAALFPMARTADPFSVTAETRLLARLCVDGFVGLAVLWSLASHPAKPGKAGVDLS
jgi:hypothetical protein